MVRIRSKELVGNNFEVYYESDKKLKQEEIDKLNDRLVEENEVITEKDNDYTLKVIVPKDSEMFVHTLLYFINSNGKILIGFDKEVVDNKIRSFIYTITDLPIDKLQEKINHWDKLSIRKLANIDDGYELKIIEDNPFPIKLIENEKLVMLDYACCFDCNSEKFDFDEGLNDIFNWIKLKLY